MRFPICIFLAMLLGPAAAMADGMAFTVTGVSMDVRATEQRAVMWLRDGNWEIHIQPVFPRVALARCGCSRRSFRIFYVCDV